MERCAAKPYEGKDPYIFVSYSHKDNAAVFPIIERLARDGYRVWYDEGIDPGTEWSESIAQHLAGSTVCLIFLSESSCASRYCKQEINYAHSLSKSLVAVKLDTVVLPAGIDLQLASYQILFKYKYANEDDFFIKLYDAEKIHICRASEDAVAGIFSGATASTAVANEEIASEKRRRGLVWLIPIGAILIALLLITVVWLRDDGSGSNLGAGSQEPIQPEIAGISSEVPSDQKEPVTTPEVPSTSVTTASGTVGPITNDNPDNPITAETSDMPITNETTEPSETDEDPETSDTPPTSDNNILIVSVTNFIYQDNSVTIHLHFDNQTAQNVSLGREGTCNLVVTTDDGVFTLPIQDADYEIASGESEHTFEVANCTGEIQSIVISNLCQLGSDGSPENEAVNNAVIYDAATGNSACICDFETGSHESTQSDFTPPEYEKPQLEPQEGALLISVEKIEDNDGTKIIWINFDNRTGAPVKWEWGKATYLWIYTDVGTHKVRLSGPDIDTGSSGGSFTVANCPGEVSSIVISNLYIVHGLYNVETATSIVIYSTANRSSSALCFN